jgi:hypothetical protein
MTEKVGFEPTRAAKAPNAFRVHPLITTWVLLQNREMVLVRGLEPPTPSLRVKCTTNCATPAIYISIELPDHMTPASSRLLKKQYD